MSVDPGVVFPSQPIKAGVDKTAATAAESSDAGGNADCIH